MINQTGKSNTSDRMMVVQYRPGYRQVSMVLLAVVLVLTLSAGFGAGLLISDYRSDESERQKQALQKDLDRLQGRVAELGQKLADAEVSAKVNQESVLMVQQSLVSLEQNLADQREELIFYKGMMSPSDLEKGLNIGSWELQPGTSERAFSFRLVVQQLASIHRLLKGDLIVEIEGRYKGQLIRYSISELSPQIDKSSIKLRFKYFQNIEGELELPADFEPLSVYVRARSTGKRAVTREKTFVWNV